MYVITLYKKPATLEQLYNVENKHLVDSNEENSYLAAPTKPTCIDLYLHHFGFSWEERIEGIGCMKVI